MKFYQLADVENKTIVFNKERIQSLSSILDNGKYLVSFQKLQPKSDIKDYRRCYFFKVDTIAFETGHSRYEMHELIKSSLFTDLMEQIPELFIDNTISTRNLTLEGWIVVLAALDLWAFTEYSIIIK
jgi:hypothetical protein